MEQEQESFVGEELKPEQREAKRQLIEAGDAAFDAEDYERALDCYHRASVLDGHDAAVWSALALTYANLEFPREAWRSHKLALNADGDDPDVLWYAGEFLFNMEDYELARLVLSRYLQLEEDAARRAEARELVEEAARQLGLDDAEGAGLNIEEGVPVEEEADEEELPEGFVVEGDAAEDEDGEDLEDFALGGDLAELDEDGFVAGLALRLTGLHARCGHCGAGLPEDAPYCYQCLTPHFYEDEE